MSVKIEEVDQSAALGLGSESPLVKPSKISRRNEKSYVPLSSVMSSTGRPIRPVSVAANTHISVLLNAKHCGKLQFRSGMCAGFDSASFGPFFPTNNL